VTNQQYKDTDVSVNEVDGQGTKAPMAFLVNQYSGPDPLILPEKDRRLWSEGKNLYSLKTEGSSATESTDKAVRPKKKLSRPKAVRRHSGATPIEEPE